MRRTHLRGHENILKRQLSPCGAFNLSLILRKVLGAGTPRQWKDSRGRIFFAGCLLLTRRENRNRRSGSRISISCTKSVIKSRSSTRGSVRLVVPKISYFHPGLLRSVRAESSAVTGPITKEAL